ncbi:hypothetical protein DCAR_0623810 [Daucus carota subsp. sativus]|uniref:Uncharacterized protein n=1 Tax=Daucus carota subsp. sativus TaxID=79200 RepID=A0A164VFG6_DAUCS|nr:hypothetical protein DCAR_0623810 [Daucus carota subsp. sativus]
MRHMETYMGEMTIRKSLLNKLRIVHNHKLLSWEKNTKNDIVISGTMRLAKGKKVVGLDDY